MEYSIRELSNLAGVSARTLRYYDEIGLLKPLRTSAAGYRIYGEHEVEILQQILFYRERGLELEQIAATLYDPSFDVCQALREHLLELEQQKQRTEDLITNIRHTLASMEGEYKMSDKERFAAFKEKAVEENERKYGKEIREKYGEKEVEASNKKMLDMTEEQYERFTKLGEEILAQLENTVTAGAKPEDEEGRQVVQNHKEWLSMTMKKYSPDVHRGIALMYQSDERFKEYYDRKVKGCADFLSSAITIWA
jgi:DNA-binding transcriptional MerR regulator